MTRVTSDNASHGYTYKNFFIKNPRMSIKRYKAM